MCARVCVSECVHMHASTVNSLPELWIIMVLPGNHLWAGMWTSSSPLTSPFYPSLPLRWLLRCNLGERTGLGIQEALHPAPPVDWVCGPGQFLVHPALVLLESGTLRALVSSSESLEGWKGSEESWGTHWVWLIALGGFPWQMRVVLLLPCWLRQGTQQIGCLEPHKGSGSWRSSLPSFCFLPLNSLPLYPWFKEALLAHMHSGLLHQLCPRNPFRQLQGSFSPDSEPSPLPCLPPLKIRNIPFFLPYKSPVPLQLQHKPCLHSLQSTNAFCSYPVPEWCASVIYCSVTNNKSILCFVIHHNCVDRGFLDGAQLDNPFSVSHDVD